MVVDQPARLAEAAGVGAVGADLRLGDVDAEPSGESGEQAGAAAAGAGDDQHLPAAGLRGTQVRAWGNSVICAAAGRLGDVPRDPGVRLDSRRPEASGGVGMATEARLLPDDAVLVHIGPYKTGTTAIQSSLHDASSGARRARRHLPRQLPPPDASRAGRCSGGAASGEAAGPAA